MAHVCTAAHLIAHSFWWWHRYVKSPGISSTSWGFGSRLDNESGTWPWTDFSGQSPSRAHPLVYLIKFSAQLTINCRAARRRLIKQITGRHSHSWSSVSTGCARTLLIRFKWQLQEVGFIKSGPHSVRLHVQSGSRRLKGKQDLAR